MTAPEEYRLPQTGFVRQKQLSPQIIPYSRATLWRHVKEGRFPAPIQLSAGITAGRVEDVRSWLIANGCDPDAQVIAKAVEPVTPPAPALPKATPRACVVIDRACEAQLVKEAAAWREAEDIRAYVAAVIRQAVATGELLSDELQTWAVAASEVANRKDPLPARAMSNKLIKRRGKFSP